MENTGSIIIAGSTGTVGRAMVHYLASRGYKVIPLVRKLGSGLENEVLWGIGAARYIEPGCAIINLAGAPVAARRWTEKTKQNIIASRIGSNELLSGIIAESGNRPLCIISASAVGYYGSNPAHLPISEDAPCGYGFLAHTCRLWEESSAKLGALAARHCIIRIGNVLSAAGGMLPPAAAAAKWAGGAYLGSGSQAMPWVHIGDLCRMAEFLLLAGQASGAYNCAAPDTATNKSFTRILSKKLNRPFWGVGVPAIALRIVLGQMSELLLCSSAARPEKAANAGFKFNYTGLADALDDLLA
jgi:uncharacterized protein